jgi:predicted nucleotidyltransferase
MNRPLSKAAQNVFGYRYPSPKVPMSAIRRFAGQIAEKFHPDKIILFGSYAYGHPHHESDVDLLVVMPAYNQTTQAIRITQALESPFSLDLIVRTPERLQRDSQDGDWFLGEVLAKGKVLYEKTDGALGKKGRGGHARRQKPGGKQAAVSRHECDKKRSRRSAAASRNGSPRDSPSTQLVHMIPEGKARQ